MWSAPGRRPRATAFYLGLIGFVFQLVSGGQLLAPHGGPQGHPDHRLPSHIFSQVSRPAYSAARPMS